MIEKLFDGLVVEGKHLERREIENFDGTWITTFTGKRFHFLDPQPDEIDIVDIAHHLSLLCRFTGACREFYSVGEHSIRVTSLLPTELKLAGLLHDAAEAYINDISRPVKYSHKLEETEKLITRRINEKFGTDIDLPAIKKADNILMATEARDLGLVILDFEPLLKPLQPEGIIVPMTSGKVERMFLRLYKEYKGE